MSHETKHSKISSRSHPCFRRSSRKPAFLSLPQSSLSSRSFSSLLVWLAFIFQSINYNWEENKSIKNLTCQILQEVGILPLKEWLPLNPYSFRFKLRRILDVCWSLRMISYISMMVYILLFEMWLLAFRTNSSGSLKLKDIFYIRIS